MVQGRAPVIWRTAIAQNSRRAATISPRAVAAAGRLRLIERIRLRLAARAHRYAAGSHLHVDGFDVTINPVNNLQEPVIIVSLHPVLKEPGWKRHHKLPADDFFGLHSGEPAGKQLFAQLRSQSLADFVPLLLQSSLVDCSVLAASFWPRFSVKIIRIHCQ